MASSPEFVAPMDVLMWKAEADPALRSPVTAVEVLDASPDWERLVQAHRWAADVVPRFRDRIVQPLGPLATARWERTRELDLRYHLRRTRLAQPRWSELWEVAAQLSMTPFDPARPPWQAMLIDGLPGGRSAYLLSFHHALSDGLGMAQIFSLVHARTPVHDPDKVRPHLEVASSEPLGSALTRQVRHDAAALIERAARGGELLGRGLRTPRTALGDLTGYLGSARRVLAAPSGTPSTVLAARSAGRSFTAIDLALPELKAAARSVGGTINDGFLAGLLGGFRRYHEAMGTPYDREATLSVAVPISVRSPGDGQGGNHIAQARLAAPVGVPDAAARIEILSGLVAQARTEPALRSPELLAPMLARLPGSLVTAAAHAALAGTEVQASNVPGLREPVFLAGAQVEAVYGFAPVPGCAAMITGASHLDSFCIGVNLDAAAVTDAALFGRCLAAGFDEVLALLPTFSPTRTVHDEDS